MAVLEGWIGWCHALRIEMELFAGYGVILTPIGIVFAIVLWK